VPLYEYVCRDCQTAFERYVKAWGDSVVCSACESANVEKRLSTFAVSSGSAGASSTMPSGGGSCCAGGGCRCH
jgi:putative FmdB family regulatory protein